ncbi:unnamed protein product, partial [Effrenium voratum]
EWLAKQAKDDRERFREATCSFGVLGIISNLARVAFTMRNIVNFCPLSVKASAAPKKPGEGASLPEKVCTLSVATLWGGLAQLARSLTVVISTCERSATVEEGCAASIETILIPWTLLLNGGIIISATCDQGAVDLPKSVEPGRRLMDPRDLPVKRQWDLAQCVLDAVDAARSIAAIGITIDAVSRRCPPNRATAFGEALSTAGCTVDVSALLSSFTKLVFYLALAVNHCSPEPERDALCLVGVSAIAAGLSSTAAGGAGIYGTCQLGPKKQLIDKLEKLQEGPDAVTFSAPFILPRKLRSDAHQNLSHEMEDLDKIWLQLGYNLSDTTAEWLRSGESPATLEIRSAAEELVRNMTAAKPHSAARRPVAPVAGEFLGTGRVQAPPCLEEGAWALSARCGVAGEEVSLEEDAGKCQARCARTLGCAAFAFWSPGGQCHLLGHLTLLAKPEAPQTPGWVSGPAACNISTLSRETRLLAQRHEDCYAPHALYQPLLEDVEPREMASALHCQQWCEEISSCAHFSFFTPTRLCHLSDAQATKLQPVLNFVAGPKSCTEFAALADLQFYQPEKGRNWLGRSALLGLGAVIFLATCKATARFTTRKAWSESLE